MFFMKICYLDLIVLCFRYFNLTLTEAFKSYFSFFYHNHLVRYHTIFAPPPSDRPKGSFVCLDVFLELQMYLCLREARNTGEKKVKLKLKETKVPRNSEQGPCKIRSFHSSICCSPVLLFLHMSRHFLGITSLFSSNFQHGVQNPYEVVPDVY